MAGIGLSVTISFFMSIYLNRVVCTMGWVGASLADVLPRNYRILFKTYQRGHRVISYLMLCVAGLAGTAEQQRSLVVGLGQKKRDLELFIVGLG